MQLKEKVSYIKGLMEGMQYDTTTQEGKLMAAVVELLDEMADEVTVMSGDVEELYTAVDVIGTDLEEVEDYLYDLDEDEEEELDEDELFEDGLYEITFPKCGEVICVDEEMLSDENLACPNCGTSFEVDFESEDEDGGEGCSCGCSEADE